MKAVSLCLAGASLALVTGLANLANAHLDRPVVIEGKDGPILLGRMVVIATPLPAE